MIEDESRGAAQAIPVTVLTGFLGAGKTTLLNRILTGDHGLRVAVLVNDFGSINIDADLVVGVESDVISLANGCICCSIRDDLIEAVTRVLERPERPEYVLLEASGVADPSGVAVTFTDERFRDRIRLDTITCVLDAEQVFAAPEQMERKLWQIAWSDMLILNKVDLVDRERISAIKAWLDDRFHRYRLLEAVRGDVPLEILLSVGRFDPARIETNSLRLDGPAPVDRTHEHHEGEDSGAFSTWTYETEQPMSLEALRAFAARLPVDVYRCKGIVRSAESPDRRAILQVVGRRVDISLEEAWGDRTPATRIVAIGARASLDVAKLWDGFDGCRI